MVGTSKILTVSYGTFSCTLEGFDDSFNTMKAIAEYFRGLAADDRYFGAEPPTPDAEMLAKIAEREIARRVDARMEDDGIVLRAAALADQSDTQADGDQAEAERQAAEDQAEADRKAEAEAQARAAEEEAARKAAEEEAARKAAEEAEAQEARQRAETEAAEAEAQAAAKAQAEAEAEAEQAEARNEDATDTYILSSVSAVTTADADSSPDPEVEETRDDAQSSVLAADDPASETYVPAHPDADSVAAKLQRIRAVVGRADNDPTNDASEPFLPQAETPDVADLDIAEDEDSLDDDLSADTAEDEAAADIPDEFETDEEDADAPGGPDMIARVMARHTDDATDAEDDAAEPAPQARVVRMKREEFEQASEDGTLDEALEAAQADAAETGPDFGLLDGADDLDEYLEDSDFSEDDAGGDIDADLMNSLKGLSGEDDDVAAAEEDADQPAEDVASDWEEDDEEETPAPRGEARSFLAQDPEVDDEALDRLMSETDAQMNEPEGSRRRNAIAQLKAAVAAKEAARQVGEADDDGEEMENAFRNDLTEAVRPEGTAPRPRPVVRTKTRTERPRPAPLKLVAAQRVDLQQPEKRDGPVVPRRVAARSVDAKGAGSFAEFADAMGATELPDLLEAAAAYTSFVEGAEEFSRPQILRRVRAVASDEFKREDGLRSFADLLRAGRFTQVRNGRFQVAGDTRFHPERQAS